MAPLKISIITPSYNQGQFLEQTIDSVLSQNYPNLEYIIIDGGSSDNSIEIIKKYEKHLTYWVSEKDNGQSHAINKGYAKATGEIINWLNSDDYYEKDSLCKVSQVFENSEVKVVCGRSRVFDDSSKTESYSTGTDIYKNNLAKTIAWARIDQPETFFRRSSLNTQYLVNERLHYIMDRDLWIRYLISNGLSGIQTIPDILVNFRLHSSSKSISQIENFGIERDTYFYLLAKQINQINIAVTLEDTCRINKNLMVELNVADKDLSIQVLNYFLLLKANEAYVDLNEHLTNLFLNLVDKRYLLRQDQSLWNTLYFRINYLPHFLIKFLRKC